MAKFDRVIPPGQEGSIEFTIDGSKISGKFSKSASVFSNDSDHQKMTITLSGEIKQYVHVKPPRLFLTGAFDDKVGQDIVVFSNEEELKTSFKILKVESNIDDKITYDFFPSKEEKGRYIIKVWKNPKLPVMSTYGNLYIYTNSKKAPEKNIQVQVTTKSQMIIKPSVINFGTVPDHYQFGKDKPLQKTVTMTRMRGEFNIEDITFSEEGFRAKAVPVADKSSYKITIDFVPQMGGRNYLSEMIVHTDIKQEPTVRVRLVARMGQGGSR